MTDSLNIMIHNTAFGIDFHFAGQRQTIHPGWRLQMPLDNAWEHGNDAIGEIHAGTAVVSFAIKKGAAVT